LLLSILFFSCDLPHELGPQPTNLIDTNIDPGIVVFGVFRPDTGMSFIQATGSYILDDAKEEQITLPNPDVFVVDSLTGEVFYFLQDSTDSVRFYLDEFAAQTGHTYQVTVTAQGYEPLTGSTTVPAAPQIINHILDENNLNIMINILPDIYSYEVHLNMFDGNAIIKTVLAGEAPITIDYTWDETNQQPLDFVVYGYERNLGEYFNTTISIKPQSYQPLSFYVEGGFGVVGAVNSTRVNLDN